MAPTNPIALSPLELCKRRFTDNIGLVSDRPLVTSFVKTNVH